MFKEEILNSEAYVEVDPSVKETVGYKITYLIKEEIRKHKWNEGTRGRQLTWEDAKNEWLTIHKENYLNSLKALFKPRKKIKDSIRTPYTRRSPVISGGLV